MISNSNSNSEEDVNKKDGETGDFSAERLKIFGLTDIEIKIVLCLLNVGPYGVSKISRVTDIPHTSIHSAIRRLKKQGLVRRVSCGYSSVWEVVGLEKIYKNIAHSLELFEHSPPQESLNEQTDANVSGETPFQVFKGVESVLRVYQWFFLNHYGEVVREVQDSESFKSLTTVLGKEMMVQLSDFKIINHTRSEIIVEEPFLDVFNTYAKINSLWFAKLKNSDFLIRTVSRKNLEKNVHMIIAHNSAIIIDWDSMTLELVKKSSLHKLLCVFFQNLNTVSEPLNQPYSGYLFEEKE